MNTTESHASGGRWTLVAALASVAVLGLLGEWVAVAVHVGPVRLDSLHATIEAISGAACLTLAVVLLLLRRWAEDASVYLFPASGLIGMGVLDLFHASTGFSNTFVWQHAFSSAFGGAGFALVLLPASFARARWAAIVPVIFLVAALATGVLALALRHRLPSMLTDRGFATLARGIEVGTAALFALALARMLEAHRAQPRTDLVFLSCFALLQTLAAISFPMSTVWEPSWWWWHVLRGAAAVLLLAYALLLSADLQSQLRAAVAARDEFLSLAAHDLRTPVTAVRLNAQLLLRQMATGRTSAGDVAPELPARMGKLVTQLDRLVALIEELLDVSRIRAGRLALHPERADLGQVVRQTLEELGPDLAGAGCAVETEVATGVQGDWDVVRIAQVLSNLLSNAKVFGAGKPIHVQLTRADGRATVAVHDSGIGIPKQDQHRIFDRFERAVSSMRYAGLGLGLYISKEIVEAHGGKIWVDSEPGAGSTFFVELPCEPADGGARST